MFITLTSGDRHPAHQNIPSHFINVLPEGISIPQENSVVALTEIHFTDSIKLIPNLRLVVHLQRQQSNNPSVINNISDSCIVYLEALRKLTDILTAINAAIVKLCQHNRTEADKDLEIQIRIEYIQERDILTITLGPGESLEIHPSWVATKIFGFDTHSFRGCDISDNITDLRARFPTINPLNVLPRVATELHSPPRITTDNARCLTYTGTYHVDLYARMRYLFIYTNLVRTSIIGKTRAQLLRIIPIKSLQKFGDPICLIFSKPYYFPISTSYIKEIEIVMKNTLGEDVEFLFGTTQVVVEITRNE